MLHREKSGNPGKSIQMICATLGIFEKAKQQICSPDQFTLYSWFHGKAWHCLFIDNTSRGCLINYPVLMDLVKSLVPE
jgi:hypothetical protein